jgi:aminobenzoyl-glutamate utilization protein B
MANKTLAKIIQKNIEIVGMPEWTETENEYAKALQKELAEEESGMSTEVGKLRDEGRFFVGGGSSDVAEVSRVCPLATVRFPGQVPGSIGHHWSSVSCNYGSTAWKGLNAGAKAMAATAIDLFTKPEAFKEVREEFEAFIAEHPYKPFLPEDSVPPLDLNRELMEKWRPSMEKFYIKKDK